MLNSFRLMLPLFISLSDIQESLHITATQCNDWNGIWYVVWGSNYLGVLMGYK